MRLNTSRRSTSQTDDTIGEQCYKLAA